MPIYERPASFSGLSFGSNLCSSSVLTYLWPGNELEQASQSLEAFQAIRIPPGKIGKILLLMITAGQGPGTASSVFSIRKRSPGTGGGGAGSITALAVTLPAGQTKAENNLNEVMIADRDEISLSHEPGVGQTSGPSSYVVASLLLKIE